MKNNKLKIALFFFALIINFLVYMVFFYETKPIENVDCAFVFKNYSERDIQFFKETFQNYSSVKNVPEQYKEAIVVALAYYPELKDVSIIFIEEKISTTMNCRPNVWQLLLGKRKYEIRINNYENFDGLLLEQTPFNAQVGVIGHELAHILDYEGGSILRIIKRGADYLSKKTTSDFEYEIDEIAIKKGFGYQSIAFWNFLMNGSAHITDEYKAFKKEIYMDKANIQSIMEETSCYN